MIWAWWTAILVVVAGGMAYSVWPSVRTRVFHKGVLYRGSAQLNAVALTFDDGPDPHYTPQLLDALKFAGIPATFFVIAEKALNHPEIVERMLAEGHDVAIHGYRHWFVPVLPPRASIRQVKAASQALTHRFGTHPILYRPTWGAHNLAVEWSGVLQDTQLVTWSVMVGDWRVTPAAELLTRIRRKWHPGAILVLHDSDETWGAQRGAPNEVIQLIPMLALAVRQQGWEFQLLKSWLQKTSNEGPQIQ
ncbi:polysaccharide deacetylase family protein [Alicyclobacillaceae bacterium I2511]|nr:polysaccharide deacetylase family protein [Alicyclobacillaceae bacterium I2511]